MTPASGLVVGRLAFRALPAVILIGALARPLVAAPCAHPDAEPSATVHGPMSHGGADLHAAAPIAAPCGHCPLAACVATVSCGPMHARPTPPHAAQAPDGTHRTPAADSPTLQSTGLPPDTPPPQPSRV